MKAILLPICCLLPGTFSILDCQAQWTMQHIGYEVPYVQTTFVATLDSNTVWTSGESPWSSYPGLYFSYTLNGGTTWNAAKIAGSETFTRNNGLSAVNDSTAWVLGTISNGEKTVLFKTQDYGQTWITQSPFPPDTSVGFDMHFFNNEEGLCWTMHSMNNYFGIFRTTDGGTSWVRILQSDLPALLPNVEFLTDFNTFGNHIWITSHHNTSSRLIYSGDRGVTWSSIPIASMNGMIQVAFRDSLNGLASNNVGMNLSETHNNGITWLANWNSPSGGIRQPRFVRGSQNTYTAGGGNGLVYSHDGGHNWSSWPTFSSPISNADWSDPYHGWVGGLTNDPEPWNTGIWKFDGIWTSNRVMEDKKGKFTLSPNPCIKTSTLSFSGLSGNSTILTLFNSQGKQVQVENIYNGSPDSQYLLDVSQLPSGMYFLRLLSEDNIMIKKLIVE